MANTKAKITQAELTRYLKACCDAGIPVARTEIGRDGKVVIITANEQGKIISNDWD